MLSPKLQCGNGMITTGIEYNELFSENLELILRHMLRYNKSRHILLHIERERDVRCRKTTPPYGHLTPGKTYRKGLIPLRPHHHLENSHHTRTKRHTFIPLSFTLALPASFDLNIIQKGEEITKN